MVFHSSEQLRAFISIDIPEQIKHEIAVHTAQIKSRCIATTTVDNLHISVLFMGDINDFQLNAAQNALCAISIHDFYMSLGEVKFFDGGKPMVAYISINEGNADIKSIFDALSASLKGIVHIDNREFIPHLTIARIKGNCEKEIKALKSICITGGRFKCNNIKIIRSTLSSGPPVYTEIFSKRPQAL